MNSNIETPNLGKSKSHIENSNVKTSNEHFLIRNTNMRNELLKKTDYLLLQDNYEKLTEEQKQEVKDYRQTLRDFINVNRPKYLNDGVAFIDFPIAPIWLNVKLPKY